MSSSTIIIIAIVMAALVAGGIFIYFEFFDGSSPGDGKSIVSGGSGNPGTGTFIANILGGPVLGAIADLF